MVVVVAVQVVGVGVLALEERAGEGGGVGPVNRLPPDLHSSSNSSNHNSSGKSPHHHFRFV